MGTDRKLSGVHVCSEPLEDERPRHMSEAKLLHAVSEAFHLIGHDNATGYPIKGPRGGIVAEQSVLAFDYLTARYLRNLADRRYEAAKEFAERAGVLREPDNLKPGMRVAVYTDKVTAIVVSKAAPIEDFNFGAFLIAAMRAGLHDGKKFKDPALEKAVRAGVVHRAPALTYEASLIATEI